LIEEFIFAAEKEGELKNEVEEAKRDVIVIKERKKGSFVLNGSYKSGNFPLKFPLKW
jgi:hypothetical protein